MIGRGVASSVEKIAPACHAGAKGEQGSDLLLRVSFGGHFGRVVDVHEQILGGASDVFDGSGREVVLYLDPVLAVQTRRGFGELRIADDSGGEGRRGAELRGVVLVLVDYAEIVGYADDASDSVAAENRSAVRVADDGNDVLRRIGSLGAAVAEPPDDASAHGLA